MKIQGSCHCQAVSFEAESYTPYPFNRCYCSICRKTGGGGGYGINIMAQADTLKIHGKKNITVYQAMIEDEDTQEMYKSSGHRHFCKRCGSCLWISDPNWPEWIYPFASAIDTPLPKPPQIISNMINYAVAWAHIPSGKNDLQFEEYSGISIEDWHKK